MGIMVDTKIRHALLTAACAVLLAMPLIFPARCEAVTFNGEEYSDSDLNILKQLSVFSGMSDEKIFDGVANRIIWLERDGLKRVWSLNLFGGAVKGAVDLSGLTALERLSCTDNEELTALNVSGLTSLKELVFAKNINVTELNAAGLISLEVLKVVFNETLTSLNVSGCAALRSLECPFNKLTSLDVSGFTALKRLHCGGNELASLDVSGLTALVNLTCSSNKLTSLKVAGCANLFLCDAKLNKQLKSIDVSGTDLKSVIADDGVKVTGLKKR
jgi:Leucine-rich repeat (LRR) protein